MRLLITAVCFAACTLHGPKPDHHRWLNGPDRLTQKAAEACVAVASMIPKSDKATKPQIKHFLSECFIAQMRKA